jgi:hypothetical protein
MLCLAKNSRTLGLRGMVHCRGAETRYRKTICEAFPMNSISKALQNSYVDSLIHGLALRKKLVMHQILCIKESDQHCLDI